MYNGIRSYPIMAILLGSALSIASCASQERREIDTQAARILPNPAPDTTLDIILLPESLTDLAGWQNVEEHLINVAPYVARDGHPSGMVNEIIVSPTRQAFKQAQLLRPTVLKQRCEHLAREWLQVQLNCRDAQIAAHVVASLEYYESDIGRDILAQELTMKYELGNGMKRTLSTLGTYAPGDSRYLVMRIAVW